jgi:long-chain acyl-CoA synthetase
VEKIWLDSYPAGLPAEIPAPEFRSLRDLFEHVFDEYADRPAYTCMGTTLSYRELDALSLRFATYLQQTLGLTRGERVAIMLPNVLQYPVALCGIFRAGLVVVNVNPLYTARELQHQLSDSGARAIVILDNFASVLETIVAKTPVEHVITTSLGELLARPKGWIVDFVVRYVKKARPAYHLPSAVRFRAALDGGSRGSLERVELGFADIAFLQYTGGTTGTSKGAMLSHRNMLYNIAQAGALVDLVNGDEPIVIITALPLYHIFSLLTNCLCTMARGGLNVLITNPRDLPAFVKEMARHPFTSITGVNTLYAALLNTPGFADLDFSHLRSAAGGGMAMQAAVAKRWAELTGVPIDQGYGLTETSPVATSSPPGNPFNGSIGLPVPSTEVMIAGDDGNPLPVGEIGEICIKGPQVMEGYWHRPAETAAVMLPGGWLRTGDIGRMDDKGFFYIEDRKKDMINVSGFNVYPNEIENVVVELDGILEAAAIGIPDEHSGEVVKVFAVRSKDSVTEQDVIDWCKANLTGYKRPKVVEFRKELPKTNVGKILRRALRDETLSQERPSPP